MIELDLFYKSPISFIFQYRTFNQIMQDFRFKLDTDLELLDEEITSECILFTMSSSYKTN